MALPASPNTISLAAIQTEFGGANPIGLAEYYKGGLYVLVTDTAPNVPASSTITLANFHSAAKASGTPLSVGGFTDGYCNNGTVNSLPACYAEATASGVGGNGAGTYVWSYVSGDVFDSTSGYADSITWSNTSATYNTYTATWNLWDGTTSIDFTVTMEHANNA